MAPQSITGRWLSAILGVSFAGLAGCAGFWPVPLTNTDRVTSYYGFSFQPPQTPNWLVHTSTSGVDYYKRTDIKAVSFFVGEAESPLHEKLRSKEALMTVARWIRDRPNDETRYTDNSSLFRFDEQDEHCVRYEQLSHDHQAANKGAHDFMVLHSVGRFCMNPHDTSKIVDLYYSIRRVPDFDEKDLDVEGEAFIQSLQFPQ